MLEGVRASSDFGRGDWLMNGGFTTSEQLERLSAAQMEDLLAWVERLPTFAVAQVREQRASMLAGECRAFLLAHAGIDAYRLRVSLAKAGVARGPAVVTGT